MNKQKPSRSFSGSLFRKYGGRMTLSQLHQFLSRESMHPWEREYTKRVIEKYHFPSSPHITEQEFKKALEEMAKNTKDPMGIKRINQLKKRFGL